ncbi:MAG: SRPBCC family protein [Marinilabiliaceae bacterium]|nr:SRPBCC family protein [Marinilabiliaceae bacterium]
MKKALLSILIIIILLIGIVVIWLGTQKSTIEISKSIEVKANSQKAFNVVSNFHTWNEWSPWIAIEPQSETTINGRGNEPKNSLSWKGLLIGEGSIEHLEFNNNAIIQKINYIKPFKSTADAQFLFTPTTDGVKITWSMTNKMPYLLRFLTSKMEIIISDDFERGLRMLKDLIETDNVASRVVVKGIEKFDGMAYVGKSNKSHKDRIGLTMKQTIYEVSNWLVASLTFPEESISIYKNTDIKSDSCSFISGFKLINANKSFPFIGAIIDSIPECNILKVTFYGDYKHLGNAWSAAYSYMHQNKLKASETISPFEIYLNDPSFFPDPIDWVTDVCIPLTK